MSDTFTLRDQRRTQVAAALDRLAVTIPDLQAQRAGMLADPNRVPADLESLDRQLLDRQTWLAAIQIERAQLLRADWTVADATSQLLFADWIWQAVLPIRSLVESDPVSLALDARPKFTPQFEQGLVPLNLGSSAVPPANLMTAILNAAGGDRTQVDELRWTAHRLWLAEAGLRSPFDHVCTLLPMRIETLFLSGDEGQELWIRLTPDEPSIARHRPLVTPTEAAFLQEFWTELRKKIANPASPVERWLEGSTAATEWEILCDRVDGPRAAWLLTSFLPTIQGDQPVITIPAAQTATAEDQRQQSDSVLAMPTEIEVWVINSAAAGTERRQLGVLRPQPSDPNAPSATRGVNDLRIPLPEGVGNLKKHWLTDFEQAVAVGLGGRLKLPATITQDSIQALFIVGQSAESPADLFQAHSAAGTIGLLRLGAPTNTVHGATAAHLAKDAGAWLEVVHQRLENANPDPKFTARRTAFKRVSHALLGEDVVLPFCPVPAGGDLDPVDDVLESQRFVRALWPVLWGHFLRDHLGRLPGRGDPSVDDFWRWSNDFLLPEGPLAPVRIHNQPYGLLPVTSLTSWAGSDAEDGDLGQLETELASGLRKLRDELVQHGRPPTTVGANTDGLLNALGRDAVTHKYLYRYWMRSKFFTTFFPGQLLAGGVEPERTWERNLQVPLGEVRPRIDSPHLALGWDYLDLPLIAATRRPFDLRLTQLFDTIWLSSTWDSIITETLLRIVPDSLCIRLMMESLMLAQAWVGQERSPRAVEQLINPLKWPSEVSVKQQQRSRFLAGGAGTPLDVLADQLRKANLELGDLLDVNLIKVPDPLADQPRPMWRMEIPAERLAQLERAFRATLDTASHRIDPWITGLAWRRLDQTSRSSRRHYATGVYGWVDGPFNGQPGPTPAGLLHAPSHAQAMTSAVLRDKFLSAQAERAIAQDANIWNMNIDSAGARQALDLAEECRLGFHLFEVTGRRVETVINDFQRIRTLRELCPLHPEQPDVMVACNGIEALQCLLSAIALAEPRLEQIRTSLTADQRKQLELLHSGLDEFADLSVADAVHHLVTGQPHRAADAMDGASGFGQPPTLESIRTPASGYRIQTTVLSVIPWVDSPADPLQSAPCRIAEPSLAAYLTSQFSRPVTYVWNVRKKKSDPVEVVGSVMLSELGWSLADTSLLPQLMLTEIICGKLNLDNSDDSLEVVFPDEYFACRQIWATLGQRPVGLDNLQSSSDLGLRGRQASAAQIQELSQGRFAKLRAALVGLRDRAQATAAAGGAIAVAEARACLRDILQWGIFPGLDSVQRGALCRFVFGGASAESDRLKEWLTMARISVEERLNRAGEVAPNTLPLLAKQIAELASSEGKLSILARWPKTDVLSATELNAEVPDGTLDTKWLTITAAVRPALARLEALQMQGEFKGTHSPLTTWTNSDLGDFWQQEFVKSKDIANAAGTRRDFRLHEAPPHLFAVYGPGNVWQSSELAVGLIDEFGETIPVRERQTYAAFGFNAPASRPQQAILLAVPPQPRTQLTNAVMLQIIMETRDLARARAVRPDDLQEGRSLISSMWLAASGPDRVRLDPDTQYWTMG